MKSNFKTQSSRIITASTISMLLLILSLPIHAQHMMKMERQVSGEVLMLQEIGGLIVDSDDGVKIDMVLPSDQRTEAYKKTDIQTGDLIKMVNGKKVKDVVQLTEIYESLKFGDELKFGIKRDKQMMIVSMPKANPDDLPGQMMMMTFDSEGPAPILSMVNQGLIMIEDESKIVVQDVIAQLAEKELSELPQKGDVLLKVQDKIVENADQFTELLDNIKIGAKVNLIFSRDKTDYTVTYTKSNNEGGPVKKCDDK